MQHECRVRSAAAAIALSAVFQPAAAQLTRAPEVVVSATRFEEPIERLPVNATVITAEEIARSAARSLPELLGSRAGLYTRNLFGNTGALAAVDMRGFGAAAAQNTLLLVDGRRLNDIDQSAVQWSSIPLEAIERIEILRGAGAVLYGDGATAGVINVITRHPARVGNRVGAAARAGSWDTYALTGAFNVFGENTGLSGFARHYESGGYRDNNQSRENALALHGTWSGEAAEASLRLAGDRQDLRLPGARMVQPSANIDQLATDRRGTSTPLDYAERDARQATLDLRRTLGAAEAALGLGYRGKEQRSYFDFVGFPDYREVDLEVYTLQPRYRWHGSLFGTAHAIVFGADLIRWDYRLLRSNARANIGQPFNRVKATQDNDALYVLDTLRLSEEVSMQLGVRRERMRIEAADRFDPTAPGGAFGSGAPADSVRQWATAYELGVRVGITDEAAVIVRTGRSFRFANVDEIYETSPLFTQEFQFLRPQRARTHEVGIAFGRGLPWLQATLFRMNVDDEIRLDPFSTGVGNRNMPPLKRTGLELELRRRLHDSFELFAAYTFTRARFREGVLPGSAFSTTDVQLAGRTVPLVPRHTLFAAADWRIAAATALRFEAHYASSQVMENDEGNTFGRRIPARTVADLKLTRRIGAWAASLGVANVFDRKYYDYAVRSQFVPDRFNAYPLPERSFWLTLEYNGL